jgi:hypothetical protein
MRKAPFLTLAFALLGGVLATPAGASEPVTFETSGRFAVADVLGAWIVGPSSVTTREFAASCDIPTSQGVDAYVVELSDEISKVSADVTLSWEAPTGGFDLHMKFTDERCMSTGGAGWYNGPDGWDEKGTFPAGTRYIVVSGTMGALVDFTLKAVEVGRQQTPGPAPAESPSPSEPDPTSTVDRSVALALRGHLQARGSVISDEQVCREGVSVILERKASEGWVAVGSTSSREDGSFELKISDRKGRYRAVAPETSVAEVTCIRTVSENRLHRH